MPGSPPPVTPPGAAEAPPIFVVGTGRSGTTLVRMMLNAHPRIYLTHEASFYLSLGGLPRRPTAEQWLDRFVRTFSFRWLRLDVAAVRAELPGTGPHALREGILAVMRAKARPYGRPRVGDKTPNHSLCLGKIFRDFPDAKVIHVVRDPRRAVESLNKMPWATSSVALNSFYCHLQVKAVQRFRHRIHELRLEDLLADPEPALRAMLAFVGEPWDDAVLDHEHHAPTDDLPPFPWFLDARRNVDRGRRPSPLALAPEWIRIVEGMNALTMRRYGYERMPLDAEPGFGARWGVRLGELPEVWGSLARLWALARKARASGLPEPREGQEELLALNPRAWAHYPQFVIPPPP